MNMTVFICKRGHTKADTKKVQLEIPERALECFKYQSTVTKLTPKQIMETVLANWESTESDFKKAISFLKQGKQKFSPTTTNSEVDQLLEKYGELV